MKFEKKFGVKVDVRIPEKDKEFFYKYWKHLLEGRMGIKLAEPNLISRYEHFLSGSGYLLPPDPFKVIAAYGRNANLDAILEARRRKYPRGQECKLETKQVKNFKRIIGLNPLDYWLIAEFADINQNGRIPIPKVVGVSNVDTDERVELSDRVLGKIKLPTTNILTLATGTKIREVFDYSGGYRLELVSR